MTANEKITYDVVSDLVIIEKNGDATPDFINPTRVVIKHGTAVFHIWRACYKLVKDHWRGTGGSVLLSSLCPKRREIIRRVIKRRRSLGMEVLRVVPEAIAIFENKLLLDCIFDKELAVNIYKQITEELLAEASLSKIKTDKNLHSARSKATLRNLQSAIRITISFCSEIPVDTLKKSAELVVDDTQLKRPKNPSRSKEKVQELWAVQKRHFFSIAEYLEKGDMRYPLVVMLEDLGYPDYALYTRNQDSYLIKAERDSDPLLAACTDNDGIWIVDSVDARKERFSNLGLEYDAETYHHKKRYLYALSDDRKKTSKQAGLYRRLSIHFASLLLLNSGCNREQLAYLNFEAKLSTGPHAKRQPAAKPRAKYQEKPVSFSANFLPIWRKYVALRRKMLEIYDPSHGPYGIPYVSHDMSSLKEMTAAQFSGAILGLPEGLDRADAFTGRKFKTTTLLDQTKGNVALVSKIIGRNEATTRKYYLWKNFNESAINLTRFFEVLTEAATIKSEGYSAQIPIIEGGEPIPTGRCEDIEQTGPTQIEGVTEFASEPRCGAPVTCFFCTHYGIHADVEDIKLILSAKAWLLRQTKAASTDINEHIAKYLPIIERIDDIIEDFKAQNERFDLITKTAMDEIAKGLYSPFWKLKLDAFLDAITEDYF